VRKTIDQDWIIGCGICSGGFAWMEAGLALDAGIRLQQNASNKSKQQGEIVVIARGQDSPDDGLIGNSNAPK
jgi:hypothetical protein